MQFLREVHSFEPPLSMVRVYFLFFFLGLEEDHTKIAKNYRKIDIEGDTRCTTKKQVMLGYEPLLIWNSHALRVGSLFKWII